MRAGLSVVVIALASVAPGCKSCRDGSPTAAVAYTSVDQVFSQPIFRYCETRTSMPVRGLFDTEETKSTGVLNRLLAEAENPQADVFWSGDPMRSFVASGEIAFGLTDTDDAHEAVDDHAPVQVVYPDQASLGTLVMPTVVVLVKGGLIPTRAAS
jgi:hypothetical protein